MIIIGEKINGAIPSIRQAIEDHNEELIRERVSSTGGGRGKLY